MEQYEATLVTPGDVQLPPFPSIIFILSCEFTISRWILRDEDMVESLVSEHQQHLMSPIVVPISLGDIYRNRKAYAIIKKSIRDWPGDHQDFIDLTLEHGLDAVESMAESDSHVVVHMHMTARLHQLFEVSPDYSDVADNEICTVCLEEFSDQGCQLGVSRLPCSHVFHQDCIKKWSRVSRFCPNCRFQMPDEMHGMGIFVRN